MPLLRPSLNHLKIEFYNRFAFTFFFKHDKNVLKQQLLGKSVIFLALLGITVFEFITYANNSVNKNSQLLFAKCNGSITALSIKGPKIGSNYWRDF